VSDPSTNSGDARDGIAFWSVDSTPRRFAEKVPVWRAPTLLLLFSVFAFGQLWLINNVELLNATFLHNDFTFAPATGGHAIPLRIFTVSFLAAFGLVCDPRWMRKLSVSTDMIVTYALYCLLMDVLLQALFATFGIIFSLHVVEIASGLVGLVVFSFKLLEHGKMPSRIPMDINNSETKRIAIRLIVVTLIAAWFAWTFQNPDLELERFMRSVGLLGGIGPGVFLFLPTFFMLLYLGAVVEAWLSPKADFTPDLTVFVPAHNEAYIIADTIAAMDKATLSYGGNIKLLVMNNASSDETQQVAQDALDRCEALTGEVIDVPKPGKANALNAGLDAVDTEYCVRVDADTLVEPEAFTRAMRHFADPTVGVVGGLPVPPGGGFFDRARFLEVAVKHGFYSVAFATINSVVGIPGMFSVYRTHLPRDLGGFVEGMNGEDTDISLRAGLLYTSKATMRGKVVLPYMLINSARRAMMIPLAVFGLIEYLTAFDSFNILTWQSLVAVFVGAPAIMSVVATLLIRRPRAILYIPEYLVFRALRAYFTLESMLSISIDDKAQAIHARAALSQPRELSPRIA